MLAKSKLVTGNHIIAMKLTLDLLTVSKGLACRLEQIDRNLRGSYSTPSPTES